MSTIVTIRQDPAADWTSRNPVLGQFEIGYESDTGKAKLGDGRTAWTGLSYWNPGGISRYAAIKTLDSVLPPSAALDSELTVTLPVGTYQVDGLFRFHCSNDTLAIQYQGTATTDIRLQEWAIAATDLREPVVPSLLYTVETNGNTSNDFNFTGAGEIVVRTQGRVIVTEAGTFGLAAGHLNETNIQTLYAGSYLVCTKC